MRILLASLVLAGFTAIPAGAADIVDTAAGNPNFSTLVAAVKAAGLVDTLKGEGPFTVFAPTNDAFAKLPAGTVESLLKPENRDKLVAVLTYHVVAGKVPASEALKLDGKSAKTVQGSLAPIRVDGGNLFVGNAQVVMADIMCDNGVIHVIDSVLLPPAAAPAAPEQAQAIAPAPVYYAAPQPAQAVMSYHHAAPAPAPLVYYYAAPAYHVAPTRTCRGR